MQAVYYLFLGLDVSDIFFPPPLGQKPCVCAAMRILYVGVEYGIMLGK